VTPPATYAARAEQAYVAMQRQFWTGDGLYRRDGRLHWPGAAAHLWPFARALVATLDLAGVSADLVKGFDADAAIGQHLQALERYWDPTGDAPAYSSDILGTRLRGERYYDDNAWVGLALVQLERLRPGAGSLERAADLLRFAVAGWDRRQNVPSPGGVFWVEQGRGLGASNHDRNTVSNAPNAELGLHLAELTGSATGAGSAGGVGPEDMYAWVNATLDSSARGAAPATGLFWDKLRGDHTVDKLFWTYNQGSMIGANVLLWRAAGANAKARYLARAEAIAGKALRHYAGALEGQPPAFNAIFFRNLLVLYAATGDTGLRAQIIETMCGYADRAWADRRDRRDRFHFPGAGATLLGQSAMVQVLALLAWAPEQYGRLT
jgi:hypothetical protein